MSYSNNTTQFRSFSALFLVAITQLARLITVSCVVGSHHALFSYANSVLPLRGAFLGSRGSIMLFFIDFVLYGVWSTPFSYTFLVYHIPGFCASLYWAVEGALIRLFVPLVCIGLFVAHPIGMQVPWYALYWLIPLYGYLRTHKTVWVMSLGATFTAHAVGTVLWLYCFPSSQEMWVSLAPVVFIERLIMALGMVLAYGVVEWVMSSMLKPVYGLRSKIA